MQFYEGEKFSWMDSFSQDKQKKKKYTLVNHQALKRLHLLLLTVIQRIEVGG